MSCGLPIDYDRFGVYALGTFELYVINNHIELYLWRYLLASVPKVLGYGSNVIEHGILAITLWKSL